MTSHVAHVDLQGLFEKQSADPGRPGRAAQQRQRTIRLLHGAAFADVVAERYLALTRVEDCV